MVSNKQFAQDASAGLVSAESIDDGADVPTAHSAREAKHGPPPLQSSPQSHGPGPTYSRELDQPLSPPPTRPKLLERARQRLLPAPRLPKLGRLGRLGFWRRRPEGGPPRRPKKVLVAALVLLLLLVVGGGVVGAWTLTVTQQLRGQVQQLESHGRASLDQFKVQNLLGAEAELKATQDTLNDIKQTYDRLGFYRWVPLARDYYLDGQHAIAAGEAGLEAGVKTLAAITPYADVLGFSGEGSFEGGTAEDRVRLIIQTLEKVTPILDEITAELKVMEAQVAQVDERRYPESFRGQPVRAKVLGVKNVAHQSLELMTEFRPIIEQLPDIAGGTGERRKYLVLFQNDNELRPTGGFMTAYSVIFMEDGKVTPEKSDDIYQLDQKFNQRIEIPEQLGRYLTTERFFNIRDMNTSPDFKVSMDQFFENYAALPGEPDDIDGIIAVDTEVLTDLVRIVGPVDVAGFGTFSAEIDQRCDCPQIIYVLSEIITRPTPFIRENRKGIIGPLMQAILRQLYASPRTFMAPLFEAGLSHIKGKHLQLYFFDEVNQQAAENINAAGRMSLEQNADFLAVINANLGGAKSNLFTEAEMIQEVSSPENGRITKTVELTYRNTRHADNCDLEAGLLCLNSTLRDWTRLYVPPQSRLVSAQGFTEEPNTYDENGFTVIDGFFILEPNSQAKLRVTYTVPYQDSDQYRLKLWKQGGIDSVPTIIDVNGNQEKVLLDQDQLYQTSF
ncbi:MAG: hypothetical protein COU69_01770 [Candidatus Pacebacteria bacterium CG10_big_fil_rev_8_21_14_0_10_56_10]|nr:MAG: hypothetical protein COU69_01770 [Candidatus Pacebacteria bacterium CG10_big_fil_rev_8_21_14_0_10_56_10]